MDLEKVDLMCQIDSLRRGWNDCIAERDSLRAERDAARDEAAGLRAALVEVRSHYPDDYKVRITEIIDSALARTPDQHRARIVAAGLREAAVRLRKQDCSDEAVRTYEWLTDEAERLEKGVGNGIHG